ncbi:orotate phosphoribosyltransferase [Rhodocytophaga aerolata]|uniref:Orotate phosphoribosyltransferase n=1 Tax=Rhodocytophaga aerolata TaxID=455078 RepID=A0ABT8R4Z8_9BACT|nr:orotate phosphoribosyltransferase [Rhodocytophaga aerolata]MDO1447153.1 orotate phosphoribosyltransferase [Rhodocytophaga aerolata]
MHTTTNTARQIAAILLQAGAVQLRPDSPFTWSSGWKSPIYCDNRVTLSYPEARTFIKQSLVHLIQEVYPQAEAIAGVATAGIPQGALVADSLNLPFVYVRSKPKEHGMTNMIEGKVTVGQKVVIVEDLISTGGSSLKVAEALREAGFEVLGMVAIFTYGFDTAKHNFEAAHVKLSCLSNYSSLLDEAVNQGYITSADIASLEEWRKDPASWKK